MASLSHYLGCVPLPENRHYSQNGQVCLLLAWGPRKLRVLSRSPSLSVFAEKSLGRETARATTDPSGIQFDEHIEDDGPTVFDHACQLGLEGIVSKDRSRLYRSGPSKTWIKIKNPEAPGVAPV